MKIIPAKEQLIFDLLGIFLAIAGIFSIFVFCTTEQNVVINEGKYSGKIYKWEPSDPYVDSLYLLIVDEKIGEDGKLYLKYAYCDNKGNPKFGDNYSSMSENSIEKFEYVRKYDVGKQTVE